MRLVQEAYINTKEYQCNTKLQREMAEDLAYLDNNLLQNALNN